MPSPKEAVNRPRRDPRADPDSLRGAPLAPGKGGVVEEVAIRGKRDPRADPDSIPAMKAVRPPAEETAGEPESERPSAPAEPAEPTSSADPRFAEIEPLLGSTAWREIADKLGPPDKAATLPPALALVYALARRESAGDESAAGATQLAIASMAAVLGVAPNSATALVLAKRLLRQNPAGWRKPAPARLSAGVIVLGLAIGAAVGWFMSLGSIKFF